MKIGHKESNVLKACQDYLETRGILYLRHNIISPVRPGQWRKVRESQRGGPDLLILANFDSCRDLHARPFPIAVECKSSTGKLSPDQKAWRARAEKIGLRYVIVREIADLMEELL